MHAQNAATQQASANSGQAAALAKGWSALASGDFASASRSAAQILKDEPQNVAALLLHVEASIAGSGPTGGLAAYEQWLGNRTIEEAYVLRRVAVAYLREAVKAPETRIAALTALATDGDDVNALAELTSASARGGYPETAALATTGDVRAVRELITQLKGNAGSRLKLIEALSKTHHPEAIDAVLPLLDDRDMFVRAAAADALGKMDAAQARPKLQQILADPNEKYTTLKWTAAAALVRLHDPNGLEYLRARLREPEPALKVAAAKDMAPWVGAESEWINEIRPLLSTSDPQTRANAAILIAPYDNAAARATLQTLIQDPNPAIRELAAESMASQVAGDFATLRQLLRNPDASSRVKAAARILDLTK
jgi:HEAT repeat protein